MKVIDELLEELQDSFWNKTDSEIQIEQDRWSNTPETELVRELQKLRNIRKYRQLKSLQNTQDIDSKSKEEFFEKYKTEEDVYTLSTDEMNTLIYPIKASLESRSLEEGLISIIKDNVEDAESLYEKQTIDILLERMDIPALKALSYDQKEKPLDGTLSRNDVMIRNPEREPISAIINVGGDEKKGGNHWILALKEKNKCTIIDPFGAGSVYEADDTLQKFLRNIFDEQELNIVAENLPIQLNHLMCGPNCVEMARIATFQGGVVGLKKEYESNKYKEKSGIVANIQYGQEHEKAISEFKQKVEYEKFEEFLEAQKKYNNDAGYFTKKQNKLVQQNLDFNKTFRESQTKILQKYLDEKLAKQKEDTIAPPVSTMTIVDIETQPEGQRKKQNLQQYNALSQESSSANKTWTITQMAINDKMPYATHPMTEYYLNLKNLIAHYYLLNERNKYNVPEVIEQKLQQIENQMTKEVEENGINSQFAEKLKELFFNIEQSFDQDIQTGATQENSKVIQDKLINIKDDLNDAINRAYNIATAKDSPESKIEKLYDSFKMQYDDKKQKNDDMVRAISDFLVQNIGLKQDKLRENEQLVNMINNYVKRYIIMENRVHPQKSFKQLLELLSSTIDLTRSMDKTTSINKQRIASTTFKHAIANLKNKHSALQR